MHLIAVASALGAEVVWLGPADEALRNRVGEAAGASGPPLEPLDLRAASTRWAPADDEAIRKLEATLQAVRAFEARLDGELVILRDLAGPIAAVRVLRDTGDRDRLFAALAYQGFAANRYFDAELGTNEDAADWRVVFNGVAVERPWSDAVALDPAREVTAYDIAEAPQRVAFSRVRDEVRRALPASVTPKDLPAGAALRIDGNAADIGPAGNAKLVPGRHLVSAELDGRIIARWDVRLGPGENVDAAVPLTDAEWDGFLASLADGAVLPEDVLPLVEAMGGAVWVARPVDGDVDLFRLGADGVHTVELADPDRRPAKRDSGASLAVAVGGAWLWSADYYNQDPAAVPHTVASVNAASVTASLALDVDVSVLRFGVGTLGTYASGEHHVALSGTASYRARPYLFGRAGLRWVQVSGGYLLPYHPAAGLHAQAPLGGPFELVADGLVGFGGIPKRDDGTAYDRGLLSLLGAGVGARW